MQSFENGNLMKKIRYAAEAVLLHLLFVLFGVMPVDMASACGGWAGRTVGPRMAASRKALNNLRAALPGKTETEYVQIVRGMWDNLGRVIAEYPHLAKIGRERTEIRDNGILNAIGNDGLPAVFITGHLANWEACAAALLEQAEVALDLIYREPNNPGAAKLLDRARTMGGRLATIPKSRSSVRAMVHAMQQGRKIGMLIDQKYNEGIPVPFFGRPAMTSPAFVQLCQKFKCPLIPGRIERTGGAHFRMTACEPLKLFDDSGAALPAETVIAAAHALFESWIAERPEQWLWLHRRWG